MITLDVLEERSAHPTQQAAVAVADKLLMLGFVTRVRKAPEGAPRDRGWIIEAWAEKSDEQLELGSENGSSEQNAVGSPDRF